jgi:NitT/TauT family transport system substrate-binding protein
MIMKKALCVMVVIEFLLVGSLSVAAETYTLGSLQGIAWAEYRVAQVKGLWEKQGITVNVIDYDVPSEYVRGAMQRRFDLAPVPMPVIATFRNAAAFDAVYVGTFSIPAYGKSIILKKNLVKKSLKGQTIGVFVSDYANRFFLSTYLKTVNTDLADIRVVQMNSNDLEANFLNDRLQVVLTSVDQENPFYEQADGVIATSISDIYQPHGLCLVKEGGATAIPPEDLKKILRGCVDAIQWMRDPANWDEYKAILKEHIFVGMPDLSDDQIRALTKEEKFVDPQTLLDHNQHLLQDYFTQYREFLAADRSLNADVLNAFTYDNVIYNQVLIEVLQEYVQ